MTDWETIVTNHSEAVWRTSYRLCGNAEDAADCFQETFLAALEFSRRPKQKVRNWPALLKRLCTFRALDLLRRRARNINRQDDLAARQGTVCSPPGPVQHAEAMELSARLRQALAALPDRQAEVFSLRCLDEMSYRDIARQLGIRTSAVGVLLHRARSRLRELLAPAEAARSVEVES